MRLLLIVVNLFRASFVWVKLTYASCNFIFYKKKLFSLVFFNLLLSFLVKMQKNEIEGGEREKEDKKKTFSKKIGMLINWCYFHVGKAIKIALSLSIPLHF